MNEKHQTNDKWNLFCECDAKKILDAHFNDASDLLVYENMDVSLNRMVTLP